jgi:flavin-dependent thymidylate synthase
MAPGNSVQKWSDVAMYESAHNAMADAGQQVEPRVTLVSMTHQPLRTMAAACELYIGHMVTDPMDINKPLAMHWLEEMTRTELQSGLEFIDLHFFFEGVTRAFTHQAVRQRTAVFVQESQRFAVKENAELEVAYPPSIAGLDDDHPMRVLWDQANEYDASVYNGLIGGGIPAEDARGRLPHNITTRMHYKTNLRNLIPLAGKRLCSQAQWEWKQVWYEMIRAILDYGPVHERWQQREIIKLFKPICYQTGRCGFHAESDRFCAIRSRVDVHTANGDNPTTWVDIDPLEPLREGAARLSPAMAEHLKLPVRYCGDTDTHEEHEYLYHLANYRCLGIR